MENAKPINVRLLAKPELCYTPSEEKQWFRRDLKERDESCPFSSIAGDHNLEATHIMPVCKGDDVRKVFLHNCVIFPYPLISNLDIQWLQMLINSRYPDFVTGEGERLDDLCLEDIKNGFLLESKVRHRLEAHDIAILPVCAASNTSFLNSILSFSATRHQITSSSVKTYSATQNG